MRDRPGLYKSFTTPQVSTASCSPSAKRAKTTRLNWDALSDTPTSLPNKSSNQTSSPKGKAPPFEKQAAQEQSAEPLEKEKGEEIEDERDFLEALEQQLTPPPVLTQASPFREPPPRIIKQRFVPGTITDLDSTTNEVLNFEGFDIPPMKRPSEKNEQAPLVIKMDHLSVNFLTKIMSHQKTHDASFHGIYDSVARVGNSQNMILSRLTTMGTHIESLLNHNNGLIEKLIQEIEIFKNKENMENPYHHKAPMEVETEPTNVRAKSVTNEALMGNRRNSDNQNENK